MNRRDSDTEVDIGGCRILIVLQVVVALSKAKNHLPTNRDLGLRMIKAVALLRILGFSSVLKASCWGFLGLWQYFAITEFLSLLGCQGSTMRMKTQLHEGEKRKGEGRMEKCWTVRWIVIV